MAYTKIKPIRARLDNCLNYALNENKTELSNALNYIDNPEKTTSNHIIFRSALNCCLDTAFEDMKDTKKRYSKEKGVLGYHIIQSFKPDEVTPQIAHKIGKDFAQRFFGDRFESVIATHVDRQHIHNHIVFNSVSVKDGYKYVGDFKNYYVNIRGISDKICREHKLSIIEPDVNKNTIKYAEWLARKKGIMTWQSIIRMDIDDAVKQSFNYGNFIMLMQNKGYEIKQEKYLSLRPYRKDRFSRTYKLGEGYDVSTIKAKILGKDLKKEITEYKQNYHEKRSYFIKSKAKGFTALCLHYMYLLGTVQNNQAPEKVSLLLKEDLLKFDDMTKTFEFLHDRNLHSYEDVINYKTKCEETVRLLKKDKINHKKELADKSKIYSALTDHNIYKEAHALFKDGYLNMQEENNKYLEAKKELKKNGINTPTQLNALQNEYSQHLERSSKYDGDTRHFIYESRMCDKAISTEEHVKKQMQKIKKLEEHKEMKNSKNINR